MNNDILITGKNGFIGSKIQGGKSFIGDIRDIENIESQIKEIKGIVHLAAVAGWRQCIANPYNCISTNLLGLTNILEIALKYNIWVLFISTYQIREKTLYGLTKLVGEELCRIYQEKGVKVKILRLHLVYGQNDKNFKVVTKIINQLRKGEEPIITTDEKFYFNYVDDVARRIENEVDILAGGEGKKYSLLDLIEGIKKCL